MKNRLLLLSVFMMLFSAASFAQESTGYSKDGLPEAKIKKLDGSVVNSGIISNDGKPIILSFWATWCKPCVVELNTISEVYADWMKETGVKLVAVSIDDARSAATVGPFINGKGWDYEVYLDPNGDFKRAMNVNMVPHTFLLDGKLNVVNQHTSFAPGDEDKLFEMVQKVAAGQPVK